MLFATLAFIIGLVYGYAKPGKEDRWGLFKKGVMYGIILGLIFGIIGFVLTTVLMPSHGFISVIASALFLFAAGTIGMFVNVVILVIIFIAGTFIGDVLENALKS